MNDEYYHKNGYQISTDKSLINFETVHKYLGEDSYWCKQIPKETLQRAIENSMCFGIYHNGEQAGFARVISDNATFAYICDVFVLPKFRGIGLSKWLIQSILSHPDLQGLRRWSLATLDAHGLYKQMGFTELSKPDRWMEIYHPEVYKQT